ncbi:MAG: 4Fe-4S cluster-binding domain-containing protein [Fibromonadaceae bacterium]|jgi:MoaA/NifB/PqqE/SkfB family radical SAM enzyme|nr:4Fe-4S cluster-binding domain-containing protein [Fibromonadaceae bacterium]
MRTIIELLLTNNCNKKCDYCIAKSDDKEYAAMSVKTNEYGDFKLSAGIINTEQLKRWLLFQKDYWQNIQLIITGGEPTIVRHYTEFIEWAYQNNFTPPILYTNGKNIKDLVYIQDVKKKIKVILTHHITSSEDETREYVKFLNGLEIKFIVKYLMAKKKTVPDFGNCQVIKEGIRKVYSQDPEVKFKQMQEYPPGLDFISPFKWRCKEHKDYIDWSFTNSKKTVVFTVDPTGNIFNCHFFREPIGTIYNLEMHRDVQLAWCHPIIDNVPDKSITLCELQHYTNLMENL